MIMMLLNVCSERHRLCIHPFGSLVMVSCIVWEVNPADMNSADWHMGSWKEHGNSSSIQAVQPLNCDSLIGNALGDSLFFQIMWRIIYGACGLFG